MESVPGEVTQFLKAMHAGDPEAADRLLPLVYSEIHRLAQAYMRRERLDHTLQATALINEAYLRLVGEDIDWSSRARFSCGSVRRYTRVSGLPDRGRRRCGPEKAAYVWHSAAAA
jgi:hypothetical protein